MCNCSKNRSVTAGGELAGYYVVRPDGARTPETGLFLSPMEARAVIRVAGGGTMHAVKRSRR